jgi:hypothetical protein
MRQSQYIVRLFKRQNSSGARPAEYVLRCIPAAQKSGPDGKTNAGTSEYRYRAMSMPSFFNSSA